MRTEYMMKGVLLHSDGQETVSHVANLLFKNNADAIIIRDEGVPAGIVTSKDIVKSLVLFDKNPSEIIAKDIMSSPIVSISHDAEVDDVRKLMLETGRRKIPVKRDIDVIGLIVQHDVIRAMSEE